MRGNANILLDNESVRPRMKAKSEEACGMRVESLKKMRLRRTICKIKRCRRNLRQQ